MLQVRLSLQQIGDQRAGINGVRLVGNDGDGAFPVHGTDALHAADRRRGVSDYHITQRAHLSSKTMAPFGQPFTQAGSPKPLSVHSSHFRITLPSGAGMTAP